MLPPLSAALYQLVGEHNPHSLDPDFAATAGLPGPISAGQVLVADEARAVTAKFADGNHQALKRIAVDHTGPHVTDQPLAMHVQPGIGVHDFAKFSGRGPVLPAGQPQLT